MAFIETTEAVIIYDALSTVFDVLEQGGSLTQKYNTITQEYVVDRTVCPLALVPKLTVTDPNEGDKTTDESSMLTVQWYRVTTGSGGETETEITATTSTGNAYYKVGTTLMVAANVATGSPVILRIKAGFVNPHTNEQMRFTKDFVLSTTTYLDFNPALELDISVLYTISPFDLTDGANGNRYRTVTAKFFAGAKDISTDSHVVYVWEKMVNNQYVQIALPTAVAGSTDITTSPNANAVQNDGNAEVVSINGRTMVLDLFCIEREKYRCKAYYNVAPYNQSQFQMSRLFTVDRRMPGYSLKPRVTVGKYLRKDMKISTAEAVLSVNSNELGNPSQYFCIGWTFYLQSGTSKQNTTFIGSGNSASVDRSKSGYDRTKVPTFEMSYEPLTEYKVVHHKYKNPSTGAITECVVVDDTDPTKVVMAQGVPSDDNT